MSNQLSTAMAPQLIEGLRSAFGAGIGAVHEFRGETSVEVLADRIREVCAWLKAEAHFDVLTDLSGVDHYGQEPRFEVVYVLYSLTDRRHLRLKVRLPENAPIVDSVTSVWRGAAWHEREAYDMFGIEFAGHPDLRRILMWAGYPHHPLRKDFPLAGLPADLPETAEAGAGSVVSAPMAGGPFFAATAASVGASSSEGRPSTLHREPRHYGTGAEQLVKLRTVVRKEPV